MFEEKKDKNKNQSSNSKKNNLFNLLQNNSNSDSDDDDNYDYSNQKSNNNFNSNNSSKKNYDYNQEFLKRQFTKNNDNSNNNFLLNNDEEEENDKYYSNSKKNSESKSSGIFGNYGIKSSNDFSENKNINLSKEVNKYGLAVDISNYETKISGMEESVFFVINLYSKLSNKYWTISHKFMDFFELHLIFDKYYVNPPYFPNGTIVGNDAVSDIHHRKTILNQYIKEVCNRSDLMTSIYCVKFLKLENHYSPLMSYYPKELYYFKDQLVLPISVSYFFEQANLLFLGCGKEYKTVFNSLLDKVKGITPFKFSLIYLITISLSSPIAVFIVSKGENIVYPSPPLRINEFEEIVYFLFISKFFPFILTS